jgi:hypothetical protein
MKFTVATFLLGLAAVNAVDLTPDNYDTLTAGTSSTSIGFLLGLALLLSPSLFSFPRIHTTPPY